MVVVRKAASVVHCERYYVNIKGHFGSYIWLLTHEVKTFALIDVCRVLGFIVLPSFLLYHNILTAVFCLFRIFVR